MQNILKYPPMYPFAAFFSLAASGLAINTSAIQNATAPAQQYADSIANDYEKNSDTNKTGAIIHASALKTSFGSLNVDVSLVPANAASMVKENGEHCQVVPVLIDSAKMGGFGYRTKLIHSKPFNCSPANS